MIMWLTDASPPGSLHTLLTKPVSGIELKVSPDTVAWPSDPRFPATMKSIGESWTFVVKNSEDDDCDGVYFGVCDAATATNPDSSEVYTGLDFYNKQVVSSARSRCRKLSHTYLYLCSHLHVYL